MSELQRVSGIETQRLQRSSESDTVQRVRVYRDFVKNICVRVLRVFNTLFCVRSNNNSEKFSTLAKEVVRAILNMWINNNNLNKYTGGECRPRWSPECWTESVSRLYEQYGADKITYILASWCSIFMVTLLTAIYFAFSERKARSSISLTVNASNSKRAVGVNKNHKIEEEVVFVNKFIGQ